MTKFGGAHRSRVKCLNIQSKEGPHYFPIILMATAGNDAGF
jgi:hypothetical protein